MAIALLKIKSFIFSGQSGQSLQRLRAKDPADFGLLVEIFGQVGENFMVNEYGSAWNPYCQRFGPKIEYWKFHGKVARVFKKRVYSLVK